MFVKGMKYEIRSVARIVLPMLIIFLCAAMLLSLGFVLDGRVFHFSENVSQSDSMLSSLFLLAEISLGAGMVLLIAVINITVYILIIYRFYVSFFTDEGYLTFTLPLTVDCHLMIKIASMFFWGIISVIVTLIGGLTVLGGLCVGYADFGEEIAASISGLLRVMVSMITQSDGLVSAQFIFLSILAFLSFVFQSLLMYLTVALGCMLFKKHKLIGSVLGIYIVNRIYSFIFTMSMLISSEISMRSEISHLIALGFMIVVASVGIIGTYIGMRYILQKKLNLE